MSLNDDLDFGWIKLHRRIMTNPRYKDSEFVHVWVHLLMLATHAPLRRIFAGKEVVLKPGQLITGRFALASDTGVHEQKVKRILIQLKTDQQIDQQTSSKCSMITILNWNMYQNGDQQNDQQMTSQRPANDQQVTTHKNIRTEEVQRESGSLPEIPPMSRYGFDDLADRSGVAPDCAEWFWNTYDARNWVDAAGQPIRKVAPLLMNCWRKWQEKAAQRGSMAQNPTTPQRAPFFSELKAQLEAKKALRAQISLRIGSGPLAKNNPKDVEDVKLLNAEIKELNTRIANFKA